MKKQYHAEFADEACVSDWLGLVNMVADDFPGLVIADYTETLLKNIARQTALCVRSTEILLVFYYFRPTSTAFPVWRSIPNTAVRALHPH